MPLGLLVHMKIPMTLKCPFNFVLNFRRINIYTISTCFEGHNRKIPSEIDIAVINTEMTKNILKYEFTTLI